MTKRYLQTVKDWDEDKDKDALTSKQYIDLIMITETDIIPAKMLNHSDIVPLAIELSNWCLYSWEYCIYRISCDEIYLFIISHTYLVIDFCSVKIERMDKLLLFWYCDSVLGSLPSLVYGPLRQTYPWTCLAGGIWPVTRQLVALKMFPLLCSRKPEQFYKKSTDFLWYYVTL